jgi:sugar phosphate isomerase/epimerase
MKPERESSVKFAVFSGSAPEWTPAELGANLARQGWDGIEWRVTDQKEAAQPGFWAGNRATFPFTGLAGVAGEIARVTKDAGLGLAGLAAYVQISDRKNVDALMAGAAACGAGKARVQVPKAAPGMRYNELFAATRADAEYAVEAARRNGVQAIIQIHHGNIISTSSAALRLLNGLDPRHIGVMHDLGNLSIEGREGLTSYTPGLEILGPYLAHVHIKNAVWKAGATRPDGSTEWAWSWAPLKTGMGDIPAYFKALKEVGYDGWVVLENFLSDPPLAQRLADDLAFFKASAAAAGYAVRG